MQASFIGFAIIKSGLKKNKLRTLALSLGLGSTERDNLLSVPSGINFY